MYRATNRAAQAAALLTAAAISVVAFSPSLAQTTKKKNLTSKPAAAKPAVAAPAASAASIELGKSVYSKQGCATCHAIGGKGGSSAPDLTNTGGVAGRDANWFRIQIEEPKKHNPNAVMPAFAGKMKAPEMAALTSYMISLKSAAAAVNNGPYIPTGAVRSWAYTTKQDPAEDHLNVDIQQDAKKVLTGQVVIRVESSGKMFYALNLPADFKKDLLPGLKPEQAKEAPGKFAAVWKGGLCTLDAVGHFSMDGKAFQPAVGKLVLMGIGSLTSEGNPEGAMKIAYTIMNPATKAVLWKADLKKVTNGYVRVEAPGK